MITIPVMPGMPYIPGMFVMSQESIRGRNTERYRERIRELAYRIE